MSVLSGRATGIITVFSSHYISGLSISILWFIHGTGTGVWWGTGNGTGTVGSNGSWSLPLARTSVNISTWYFPFVPVAALVPFPYSVNEMVSLRDTAISLHILQRHGGGVFWVRSDLGSARKIRVFNFREGGCSG